MSSPSRRNRSLLASGKPTSSFAVRVPAATDNGVMFQIGSMMLLDAPNSNTLRRKIADSSFCRTPGRSAASTSYIATSLMCSE